MVRPPTTLLTPRDFVHAPAGTVHTFAVASHTTRLLGLLTFNFFEPFFDVTGVPTDDPVRTQDLVNPSTAMDGMRADPELDVAVDGPPRRDTKTLSPTSPPG